MMTTLGQAGDASIKEAHNVPNPGSAETLRRGEQSGNARISVQSEPWYKSDTFHKCAAQIVGVLGLLVAIVGLILVVITLKCMREDIQLATHQYALSQQQNALSQHQNALSQMSSIDDIFVQSPGMYPYFYEGIPIDKSDRETYRKAVSIAMAMTNCLEGTLPSPGGAPMPEHWQNYMHDQFVLSPIMCEYLESRKRWFDTRLYDIMKGATKGMGPHVVSDRSTTKPDAPASKPER